MRNTAIIVLLAGAMITVPAIAEKSNGLTRAEPTVPQVEAVFVLDTTGSMGGLIAAAKEKIWAIANTLATADPAPQIKMGLVGYRDHGDNYVTRRLALTDDLDAVYAFLMEFQAGGGGDSPESVNQALHEAVTQMAWSTDERTYRVVFLVGDCPPHMDYSDDIQYPQSCKHAAERGIIINTIQCGNEPATTSVWSEIAGRAEGQSFRVEQAGGAIAASTPFDGELGRLSRELDGTRIYYGSPDELARQAARDKTGSDFYLIAPSSALAARATFNASEAGKLNFFGGKELIDDITVGRLSLSDVKSEELSGDLRSMSPAEREVHVRNLARRRTEIQKQIAELSGKRQAHIKEQVEKANDVTKGSLDAQLYECVKTQAGKKDIIYKAGPLY
jgi:hypothetical protein